MTKTGTSGDSAKTVEHALQILGLFTHTDPEWAVKDIASVLGFPYSSAYRYVGAVRKAGYLTRDERTGKYQVGLAVVELAGIVLNQLDVRVHGLEHLDHLADVTALNANLAVLHEADVLHVAYAVRSAVPRSYTVLGRKSVAHCTALGKVMLADLPFTKVCQLIDKHGWRPCTSKSITNFTDLERALTEVKINGYSLDLAERNLRTHCVAAPIHDRTGRVVGAISVSGPQDRLTEDRLRELIPVVKVHAEMISRRLGYAETVVQYSGIHVTNERPGKVTTARRSRLVAP